MEQKIMMMLGERDFVIAQQAAMVEQLQKEIEELKAKVPGSEEKKDKNENK